MDESCFDEVRDCAVDVWRGKLEQGEDEKLLMKSHAGSVYISSCSSCYIHASRCNPFFYARR